MQNCTIFWQTPRIVSQPSQTNLRACQAGRFGPTRPIGELALQRAPRRGPAVRAASRPRRQRSLGPALAGASRLCGQAARNRPRSGSVSRSARRAFRSSDRSLSGALAECADYAARDRRASRPRVAIGELLSPTHDLLPRWHRDLGPLGVVCDDLDLSSDIAIAHAVVADPTVRM